MLQKIVGQYVDSVGDSLNIGFAMNLPQYVDSVGVKVCSQAGIIEQWTIFKNISASQSTDTTWYNVLLKTQGEKSIIAQAYIQQSGNYCDTIQINVFNMSAPVITANPANQAVCLGSPDSFSVTAAGPGPLTYQWKNAAGNLTGTHYIGVTTNKLTIDSVLISDTGSYICAVTNSMDSTVSSSSAKLTINTDIVKFSSNGGNAIDSQSIMCNTFATAPTTPRKTGYTFSGWYVDSLLTIAFSFSMPITSPITLYAKWTLNIETVSFNSNDGSPESDQAIAYDSTATLPAPAPSKAGYSFAGWYSDSTFATAFSFSTHITTGITLYAKWALNTFPVSLNSNGGSAISTQTIAYNATATQPTLAPTKTGYIFSGWYSDSLLTKAFSFSTPITAAITLYAKWTTNTYAVSFNSNGGNSVGTQTITYDSTVIQPSPAPTKSGYVLSGWFSDSLLTIPFSFSTPITAAITLYAKWVLATFTVSFNSNGGTACSDQIVHRDSTAILPSPTPTKTGYTFSGWYSDSTLATTFNFSTPIMAAITLYAKWTANSYAVTFNSNGGSSIAPQTVSYNDYAAQPSVPTKTGYTFVGWFSDSLLTTVFLFSTPITASITLYAQWSLIPTYMVTYIGNGNTGGAVPVDGNNYQQGVNVTVIGNTGSMVKTGSTFAGWNTIANGSGTIYAGGAIFSIAAANVTLYAQWSLIPTYTVTYIGNGNTGGSAPIDGNSYQQGVNVTIIGNMGNLVKTGPTVFAGWNTFANGSGASYSAGSTFPIGSANVTLYAQWMGVNYTDIDGNVYHPVTIGAQVWMVENLKTTRYNDGSTIPLVTDSATWSSLTTPGYCWYNNSYSTYGSTYGALYNWYAVNTGKLAPSGWHVPTDAEWTTLTTYLGDTSVAGGALKSTGTAYWLSPNTGATNSSGFSALPGHFRSIQGSFAPIGVSGYWWSSTAFNATFSWDRYINYDNVDVYRFSNNNTNGFSVRCVRDNSSGSGGISGPTQPIGPQPVGPQPIIQ